LNRIRKDFRLAPEEKSYRGDVAAANVHSLPGMELPTNLKQLSTAQFL
jgi:hypothetical protein